MNKAHGRRKKILIFCLSVILLLSMIATFLAVRADVRFLLVQSLRSMFSSASVEPVVLATETYSFALLRDLPGVNVADNLMLVNARHFIDESYEPQLSDYHDVNFAADILPSYRLLADKIMEDYGTPLYIRSAFRTEEDQKEIYDHSAADVAAPVGASEHQTGLALDVYVPGYAGSAFLKSPVGRYVNSYCYNYGFIIRYPFGKTDITGITYEPWHLRYVGVPHAELIMRNGLTLEEYIEVFYEPDVYYEYGEYYICRATMDDSIPVPTGASSMTLSPDNTGFVFITILKSAVVQ